MFWSEQCDFKPPSLIWYLRCIPDLEKVTALISAAPENGTKTAAYLPPLGHCEKIGKLIFEKVPSIYERTKGYFYAYLSMCGCR